jgi:hypothetical protein
MATLLLVGICVAWLGALNGEPSASFEDTACELLVEPR